MAYYEERRYTAPRDRDRARPVSYAADYYQDTPRYSRYERDVYPNESVEEIQRDYPPGEGYVYERGFDSRRSRRPVYENVRRASSANGQGAYYDEYRSRARPSRGYDDRQTRRSKYSSPSPSPSPPRHRRRKSFSEQALGAIGLGGAAARYAGDRGRDRDGRGRDSSRYRRYSSDSRSRSRGGGDRDRERRRRERSEGRISQAARTALTAGAVEAFRARKEPGEWTGAKGKRILTAAVTAAATDGLVDKDPKKHSKRHMIESTLAGLAANHFVNGGRSQSRGGSRSRDRRGRSSGGGIKDLAATGALAAAGKEIYDRISRSRSRPRGRDASSDSEDDRRGTKKRSKSVSEYLTKGMAALGLGEEANKHSSDSRDSRERGDRRRYRESRRGDRSDSYSDSDGDSDDDYHRGSSSRDPRRSRGSRDVGRYRSVDGRQSQPPYPYNDRRSVPSSAPRGEKGCDGQAATKAGTGSHSSSESDSDLGNSDDEKKQRKKMRRDMMLTGGLATVATIHAAHSVYGGIEKRKKRMKELEEGKISPEEARKRKIKANTIDAFSVGLAALGIKGAYSEWEEVNEKRKEHKHFQSECEERAKKRHLRQRSHSHAPPKRNRWPDEIEYPPSRTGSLAHQGSSEPAQISY
ncbi:hypothetical protein N7466_002708 [Penicillium verhagenii]|uniref:uncharacterized protein n=1 Tax=Penicillium verhagenii TaxID=1562060 RepID=UPI0025450389|nr:uncharacterized protein N7466_002708 [Penicillium verhagenii]KAJ5939574.1 hypothetical protein N7466_002708 [Penicillium verhagenii]